MCHSPSPSNVTRLRRHVSSVMSSLSCHPSPRRLTRHPTRRCASPPRQYVRCLRRCRRPPCPPVLSSAPSSPSPVNRPPTHAITGHPRHASAQPFFPSIYQIFPTPPPSAPPGHSDISVRRAPVACQPTNHPRRPPVPCALQPRARRDTRRAALTCLLCFGPRSRRLPRRPRIFHGHKFGPLSVLPGESDVVSRII